MCWVWEGRLSESIGIRGSFRSSSLRNVELLHGVRMSQTTQIQPVKRSQAASRLLALHSRALRAEYYILQLGVWIHRSLGQDKQGGQCLVLTALLSESCRAVDCELVVPNCRLRRSLCDCKVDLMDPFSLALGTFGITNSAISSIRGLRRVINDVSGARELVGDTDQDLEGILVPLDALQKLRPHNEDISRASQQALKETGLADAVNKCAEACNVLAEKIRESTRHSSDSTKLSLRDRVTVGILNKEKIQTFRTRVKCSLSIVQYAVQSTQLYLTRLRWEGI